MKINRIEKVYWRDVRDEVMSVNPSFAKEIDQLDPGDDLYFYRAHYRFGRQIMKDSKLQLPDKNGELHPVGDSALDRQLSEDFAYITVMPIGIVLKNSIQLYINRNNQPLSWRYMKEGRIFALWGMLQPENISSHGSGNLWQMRAGAHSMITLPKISLASHYKKLRKALNLKAPMPLGLDDQWPLLVDIANAPSLKSHWETSLLFFPKTWYQNVNAKELVGSVFKDANSEIVEKAKISSWQRFRAYLTDRVLLDTIFFREIPIFDHMFTTALNEANTRPNPYLADTIRHLFFLASGAYPAFRVAIDDSAGPVSLLQKILVDIYGISQAPIIMHFDYFDHEEDFALYYSLHLPSLLSFLPKSKKMVNKLEDFREIKHLYDIVKKYFAKDKFALKGTFLYEMVARTEIGFFHSTEDTNNGILAAKRLPQIDTDLEAQLKKFKKLPFAQNSAFLNGCARIVRLPAGDYT